MEFQSSFLLILLVGSLAISNADPLVESIIGRSTAEESISTQESVILQDYSHAVAHAIVSAEKFNILQEIWNQTKSTKHNPNMHTVLIVHKILNEQLLMRTAMNKVDIIEAESMVFAEEMQQFWLKLKNLFNISNINSYLEQRLQKLKSSIKQQQLVELYQEVRELILTEYGQRLGNILSSVAIWQTTDFEDLQQLNENLYTYDALLLDKIYEFGIDKAYGFESVRKLSTAIQRIGDQHTDDLSEIQLKAQLYLFAKFKARNDIDDNYLLQAGYIFQKYMLKYSRNTVLERRLNQSISLLPTAIMNLFNGKLKCLKNVKFQEYLYVSPTELDAKRHYVFTWYNGLNGINPAMNMELNENYDDVAGVYTFSHQLFNVHAREYVSRDESFSNRMVAWRQTGPLPVNSTWNVSVHGKGLMFKQDEYILCASKEYNAPNTRRWVEGWTVLPNDEGMCEWIVSDCGN